ncbi:MAG: 23S rRNA (adenine(2503)-C(2))-methyltransferase RlmN [Desulfohalobium sp.]
MTNIHDATYEHLVQWVLDQGQPRFRADQIWNWVWAKGVTTFTHMRNIPQAFRGELASAFSFALPTVADVQTSQDGSIKLLLKLADGHLVETVLIPGQTHYTQCLSSQVGCALGCTFCSTGQMGLTRNMTAGEIAGQVLLARHHLEHTHSGLRLRNLVFMGMGEPLLNWPHVDQALDCLTHKEGMNFSPRRITVSTVGISDTLDALGHSHKASLAVSLHAPTQSLREALMPKAARMLPLEELLARLRSYPLSPRQRITIEYVLLGGVNDSLHHARDLVRSLNGIRCKINLIAFNACPGLPYASPDPAQVLAFEDLLHAKGMTATLRKSKGQDIAAACGQLKALHNEDLPCTDTQTSV